MHFKRLISRFALLEVTLPSAMSLTLLCSASLAGQVPAATREVTVAARTFGSLVSAGQSAVALDMRNIPLAEALDRLVARGVPLIYSSELVKNSARVTCARCENVPARTVLTRILAGTGIGFRELPGGELLLSRVAVKQAVEATVRGRVIEAVTGNGIERATVTIVGTDRRAFTNSSGNFAIPGVAAGSRAVRVVRLGYSQAERVIVVPESGAIDVPVIAMDRIAAQLNPLEIKVSTGSIADTERKKLSNAIVVISSEEILLSGARDLPEVLRARAPGVEVTRNSGANGVGGTIQIRGVSSIIQDQSPLIYVDGVPVDGGASALNGRGSHAFSGPDKNIGSQLRIDELTLDQIERIEIIKGPAATTLYGTQGSNGVIQIFTKRGIPGETRITVSSETGMARLRKADDFGAGLPYRDQFLSQFRTPRVQEHHVGVSGGAGDITYSLGAAYAKDAGYIPRNGETRSSLNTSFRMSPTRQLSVQLSGSMVRRNFESAGLFLGSNRTTPEQVLQTTSRTDTDVDRTYGSLSVSYQPSAIWQNRLTIGTDNNSEINERLSLATATGITRDRISREFRRTSGNFVSTLSYPQTGRVTSTLSVGGEGFYDVTDRLRLRGQGLPSFDVTDFDLASTILGGDQGLPTDLSSKVAQVGGFLQEQLGINDRLFLTAGVRADGNSTFGDDYGIQFYPKLGASYVFQPASWWNGKVRSAWGRSGKAPPPFAKDLIFALSRGVVGSQIGLPLETLFDLGNPDLRPELVSEWEFGTENYFLENRASVELNYFRQTTRDAHIRAPIPLSTGLLAGPLTNIAALRSSGIEAAVRTTPFDGGSTSLDIGFTLTRLIENGLITKLGNDPILTRFNQGFELGTFEGLREGFSVRDLYFTSIFPDSSTPGYTGRAFVLVGSRVPTTFGGVNFNLRFLERARLYANFSYSTGGYGFDQARFNTDLALGYLGNGSTSYSTTGLPPGVQDRYIFSTDQLRLEILRLAYQIPKSIVGFAREAEVWVEGDNIFSRDRFDRGDPEAVPIESSGVGFTGGRGIVPPRAEMYKIGVRLTF